MTVAPYHPDLYPGIYIASHDRPEFRALACRDLNWLRGYTLGKELLALISKRTQGVGTTRTEDTAAPLRCIITWNRKDLEQADSGPMLNSLREERKLISERNKESGLGAASTSALEESERPFRVSRANMDRMNMDMTAGDRFKRATRGMSSLVVYSPWHDFTPLLGVETYSWIVLAHELIHSLHHLSGDTNTHPENRIDDGADTWTMHEEARTVGLGPYSGARLCENSIRRQAGLPERMYYLAPGDTDTLSSVITGPPMAAPTPPPVH